MEPDLNESRARSLAKSGALLGLDTGVGVLAVITLIRMVAVGVGDRPWQAWLSLSGVPTLWIRLLLAAFVLAVVGWFVLPPRLRPIARAVVGLAGLGCLADAWNYHDLLGQRSLYVALPISLSLPTGLVLLAWSSWGSAPRQRRGVGGPRMRVALVVACLVPSAALPVWFFGATDYRRPADAIVVLGAAVWPDGQPSLALEDRTRSGCQLYLDGLADCIVFSGGRSKNAPISEPEAMRRIGLEMGVPEAAMILDDQGINTQATVWNTTEIGEARGWSSVLMVSHDYHLLRIKMLSERSGLRCYTVPAKETRPLRRYPYYLTRELAALAWYYLTPQRASAA